jgi:tetratricopeptide (TPR) repeat protein
LAKLTNQTALIRDAAVKLSLIGKIELESIKDILIFMKQNDFGDLLIETLSKQIKVYPTNTYLIYTLVEELAQRGQFDEALSALELVEVQSSVDVMVTRGTIKQQQGKLKQAQQNFEDAYSAFPSVYTLKKLINFYSLINENESALKALYTHIESFPTDNQAKLMLAFRSSSSDAIRLYREVLIDSPDNSVALNNLAWELHNQGKNEEAIEFSDKAVKISPEQESFQSTNKIIRGALLEN